MITSQVITLKKYQEFHPVVPFTPGIDRLVQLDFTVKNKTFTDEILTDTKKFITQINHELQGANARYGIGGYGEHRSVYSRSKVFDPPVPGEEPRRLHLGTDIWGKPHTAVMAPMEGIVHSFAFNDQFGDYGTTILLSHRLGDMTFHTLYGHLGLNSIKNLSGGERVQKGDIFAEFGIPAENGHWPPHLHFQIIFDLDGWKGDYPGVCKFSEKEKWLANCPDPDLILDLNKYL
jgi:murein DD-endopeptidase MepM/ murein hydrolase activator NlpD